MENVDGIIDVDDKTIRENNKFKSKKVLQPLLQMSLDF